MKTLSRAILICAVLTFLASGTGLAAKWNAKLGHDQPATSPHHQALVKFKDTVEKGSNGQIAIEIFEQQKLGTGIQMVEMVQAGALEFLAVPTSNVQVLDPTIGLLDLPFLVSDRATLYKLQDGQWGADLYKPLEAQNIIGLSFLESGFKQFTGNFPIHTPADYKGRKIRVMPLPVLVQQFKALGAIGVPIDFAELYNALQQGVVDGQENPITTIWTKKFYEVQKYMAMSNHGFLGYVFIANKGFMDSLPAKYQKLVKEAALEASQFERALIAEKEKDYLKDIKAGGVTVIQLSPTELAQFQKAMLPVHDWFVGQVPTAKPFLDAIKKAQ